MRTIKELQDIAQLLNKKKGEDILDALHFLNQPTEDYATKDYFNVKDLKNNHMQFDVFLNTYKGKSLSDYEEQRLKALMKIENTENIADSFSIAVSEAANIREGIHGINYNEMYKSCCKITFMIEVCKNMMLQGATLTEITKYIPESQMGDIYHLATDYLGIKLEISNEEKEKIKHYDEMVKKGTLNSVTMRDIMRWKLTEGIPHIVSDKSGWSIDGEQVYDTLTMACVFAECQLSFPYYYKDKMNPSYANSFDELLEEIMLRPDKLSFDGLEESYSSQEWNLLNRIQKKFLSKGV